MLLTVRICCAVPDTGCRAQCREARQGFQRRCDMSARDITPSASGNIRNETLDIDWPRGLRSKVKCLLSGLQGSSACTVQKYSPSTLQMCTNYTRVHRARAREKRHKSVRAYAGVHGSLTGHSRPGPL